MVGFGTEGKQILLVNFNQSNFAFWELGWKGLFASFQILSFLRALTRNFLNKASFYI